MMPKSPPPASPAARSARVAIAIHGGAGKIRRADMTPDLDRQHRQMLLQALRMGHGVLAAGGSSLAAVEAAILLLEDSPLFNAGKGAVLTNDGRAELDASIMEGRTLRAGAVACVTSIRNPILAATAVMNRTPHVLLMGRGAEEFAREAGLEMVENAYFLTERRQRALREAQQRERASGAPQITIGEGREDGLVPAPGIGGDIEEKYGTVGCVALDHFGDLAAGTSSGGLTNKRFGRVGDTPIIGAGNYADNETCAVSGTGQGEYFMRLMIAADVSARMRYAKRTLEEASAAQMRRMTAMGAMGGLVSLDRSGEAQFVFNTEGMYRGVMGSDGEARVAIFGDADDRVPGDHASNGSMAWDDAGGRE
jgi:beta-aspartyl-peptidase (threonine type)